MKNSVGGGIILLNVLFVFFICLFLFFVPFLTDYFPVWLADFIAVWGVTLFLLVSFYNNIQPEAFLSKDVANNYRKEKEETHLKYVTKKISFKVKAIRTFTMVVFGFLVLIVSILDYDIIFYALMVGFIFLFLVPFVNNFFRKIIDA
ncbi:hypothetical protein AMET1_1232 [Methanonatronarchaeum thermophilum]|uniref:Uncharacterized protein n=1 Tax=Methanonatronarchaeum thermophilum TaxID=1927129 RepID=A0A1Y3GA50_9EURY|nr:hypothetical protein [Methanonatronarchaeum thermophilum]OUJ18321.1 hypothetical protein AMET1_1232 [Methanonatronarchaeum thermophilum]